MSRRTSQFLSTALAVVLALSTALALAHWAACEQDDAVCLVTGKASQ